MFVSTNAMSAFFMLNVAPTITQTIYLDIHRVGIIYDKQGLLLTLIHTCSGGLNYSTIDDYTQRLNLSIAMILEIHFLFSSQGQVYLTIHWS